MKPSQQTVFTSPVDSKMDPVATMMSDDDMDGVYEVTVDLPADSTYEFKFINGMAWDFVEDVPPTCQVEVAATTTAF